MSFIRIHGAGIAGACLAFACRKRKIPFEVVDPYGIGSGASGNAVALVSPRLIAGDRYEADFCVNSFLFACNFYDQLQKKTSQTIWFTRGLKRILPPDTYPAKRLRKIQANLGEPLPEWILQQDKHLYFPYAGSVCPPHILKLCLEGDTYSKPSSKKASHEIYATGSAALPEAYRLVSSYFTANRGVLSCFTQYPALKTVISGQGYVANSHSNTYAGATYQRWSNTADSSWQEIRPEDHQHNQRQAEKLLTASPGPALDGRASLRATSRDRLPIADKNLCLGFGSRGFTYAPIIAENLISEICGECKHPMPEQQRALLVPERFLIRQSRKRLNQKTRQALL